MKTVLAALIALGLAASVAGCGKKGPLDVPPPEDEQQAS